MSAPGSSAPPGPAGPPGYRRPPKSNPLVVRRKGVRVPDRKQPPPPTAPIPPGALPTEAPKKTIHAEDEPEPTGPYRDIPVVLTKKMIIDGLRFHALKLQAENSADITDPEQWPRPVRLHRRDPRAAPTDESAPPPEPVIKTTTPEEDKEREKLEALKAERKRIRDENQAQIAPSAKQQQQPAKTLQFKRKFEQVFLAADTVEGRAKSQIKYEESLPWHLEDDDGKNIWKGSYVSELSKRNAMLVFEGGASAGSNQIRIVMVEKWYRFQERTKFRPLEYEEAEAQMNQKFKNPKWMVEIEKQQAESAERERNAQALSRVVKVKGGGATSGEFGNIDDVDFDEREIFDDDDEGGHLLGHDEDEAKEAENRIRQGQYSFNAFGEQETNGKGDGGPTKKELELKQLEKKMRRKLAKKDVNYLLSDDDSDPYASSVSVPCDQWDCLFTNYPIPFHSHPKTATKKQRTRRTRRRARNRLTKRPPTAVPPRRPERTRPSRALNSQRPRRRLAPSAGDRTLSGPVHPRSRKPAISTRSGSG